MQMYRQKVISRKLREKNCFLLQGQSGQLIRIRNMDPDPGGQTEPTKVEKN
jgi:hypothetical protein